MPPSKSGLTPYEIQSELTLLVSESFILNINTLKNFIRNKMKD